MREITISSGDVALVSDEDFALVNQWKWKRHQQGYAARSASRSGKWVTVLMHRLIANPPDGHEVHHLNGNKLDNRRENLEVIAEGAHRLLHIGPIIASAERRRKHPQIRTCISCHNEFVPARSRRSNGKYCSKACMGRATALRVSGEGHWNARTTEAQAREVLRMWSCGARQMEIMRAVGVSRSVVAHITSGDRWAYLAQREESEATA